MPSSIQNSSTDDYSIFDALSTDDSDSTDYDFDQEMTDEDELAVLQQQQYTDSFVDLRKKDDQAAEATKAIDLK